MNDLLETVLKDRLFDNIKSKTSLLNSLLSISLDLFLVL